MLTAVLCAVLASQALEGRLIDHLGRPVPGARIAVGAGGRLLGFTDPNGIYKVPRVGRQPPWVEADGYAPAELGEQLTVIHPGRALTGTVVDDRGRAVAGAVLVAWHAMLRRPSPVARLTATTGEAGRFELLAPIGPLEVVTFADGFASRFLSGVDSSQPARIELTPAPTATLELAVEAAHPDEFRAYVAFGDGPTARLRRSPEDWIGPRVLVDAGGVGRAKGLPPGPVLLLAGGPRERFQHEGEIRLETGQTTVVRLRRVVPSRARVRGCLADSTGAPLRNATILIDDECDLERAIETDDDGEFEFASRAAAGAKVRFRLADPTLRLRPKRSPGLDERGTAVVADGEELELVAERVVRLSGQVATRAGRPVDFGTIALLGPDSRRRFSVKPPGRFAITVAADEAATLRLRHVHFTSALRGPYSEFSYRPGEPPPRLRAIAEAYGRVDGVVVDAGKRPVAGVPVRFARRFRPGSVAFDSRLMLSDANGRFGRDLPAGDWTVMVTGVPRFDPMRPKYSTAFAVRGEEAVRVELQYAR